MIHIDRHIEILLLNNDCVIVPGFGGFMTHYIEARYSTESQCFLPPLRQLGFNPKLQLNDSLLAQSYIEAYDISYPEAITRIEEEVTEIRQMLEMNGSCELNDIGVLSINAEGKIEFMPCEAGILSPELYGLNSIDIPCISTIDISNAKTEPTEDEHDLPVNQKPLTTEEKVEKKAPKKDITISISSIKRTIAVAASAVILFLFALPLGNEKHNEVCESVLDTNTLYAVLPKDIKEPANINSHPKINSAIDVKKVDIENVEPEKKEEEVAEKNTKANDYYAIVIASQVAKRNAEIFINQLKNSGFSDAHMVERSNGMKVVYGQYGSETEAANALRKLRSAHEAFAEGWIMKF